MNKSQNFFENTKDALPHINVRRFCELNDNVDTAIDYGCGAGRDTIFLIKNGWKVISIDRENTKSIIEEHLSNEKKRNEPKDQPYIKEIAKYIEEHKH